MTPIARRRLARSACRQRRDSWYWSWLARVIAPAQREDDTAVSAFFRPARRFPPAGTFPIRMRSARSAR